MKKRLTWIVVIIFNFIAVQAEEEPQVNAQASAAISQHLMESQVFHLINQHRAANFLPPLRWHSAPAHHAREHSLNMANKKVPFGHQGADVRFTTLRTKIPTLTGFAENVAYNYGYPNPAEIAVNGWLASSGHYANIMGNYSLAGVGVAVNSEGEYYFTQIFVRTRVPLPIGSFESGRETLAGERAGVSEDPIQIDY